MKRLFLVAVCLILFIGCAGMTRDIKKEISDELQPATLRTSFNTQPENLKVPVKMQRK